MFGNEQIQLDSFWGQKSNNSRKCKIVWNESIIKVSPNKTSEM